MAPPSAAGRVRGRSVLVRWARWGTPPPERTAHPAWRRVGSPVVFSKALSRESVEGAVANLMAAPEEAEGRSGAPRAPRRTPEEALAAGMGLVVVGGGDVDQSNDVGEGRAARVFVAKVGPGGLPSAASSNRPLLPGTLVAVKTPLQAPAIWDEVDELREELDAWSAVNGVENVVGLHDVHPSPLEWGASDDPICFVMEFMEQGSLRDVCAAEGREAPDIDAPALAADLVRGVAQCHAAGWAHRDVKTPNALLGWDRERGRTVCKLCDFGSAVRLSDVADVTAAWCALSPEEQRGRRRDMKRVGWKPAGTLLWMPPEAFSPYWELRDESADPEAMDALFGAEGARAGDVWAAGVCAWELLARELPLLPSAGVPPTRDAWKQSLAAGERWPLPSTAAPAFAAWLAACWDADPAKRPGAADAADRLAELGDGWDTGGATAEVSMAARTAEARRARGERWTAELAQCRAKFGGRCAVAVHKDSRAPADRRVNADGARVDVESRATGAPLEVRLSGVIIGVRTEAAAAAVDEAWSEGDDGGLVLEPGTGPGEGDEASDVEALLDVCEPDAGNGVRERGEPAFFDIGGCRRAPARPKGLLARNVEIAAIMPAFARETGFIVRCLEGHEFKVRLDGTTLKPGEAALLPAGKRIRIDRVVLECSAVVVEEEEEGVMEVAADSEAGADETLDEEEVVEEEEGEGEGEDVVAVVAEEEEEKAVADAEDDEEEAEEDVAAAEAAAAEDEAAEDEAAEDEDEERATTTCDVLVWEDAATGEDLGRFAVDADAAARGRGLRLGRDPTCDIRISGCDAVSRLHARLAFERGAFRIYDDSTNGTFVNGEALRKGRPRKLAHGDRIELARGEKGARLYFAAAGLVLDG